MVLFVMVYITKTMSKRIMNSITHELQYHTFVEATT